MIGRCLVLTGLLLGAWVARVEVGAPEPVSNAEQLARFPVKVGPWVGTDLPLDDEVVKTAAVNDYLNRAYSTGSGDVSLYIGYYRTQRQGEALHSPLFCLPGAGWQPTTMRDVPLSVGAQQTPVKELVVERGSDRLLVLYWYQTLNRVTGSEYARKLFLVKDAFLSGRTDVALVRIIAPLKFQEDAVDSRALALARPFAEMVLPEVQQRLFRP